MVLKKTTEVVFTNILKSTIMTICRELLPHHNKVSIEGLLGVTLDDRDVVLVNVTDSLLKSDGASHQECVSKRPADDDIDEGSHFTSDEERLEAPRNKRSKKKRRKRTRGVKEELQNDENVGDHAYSTVSDVPVLLHGNNDETVMLNCNVYQMPDQQPPENFVTYITEEPTVEAEQSKNMTGADTVEKVIKQDVPVLEQDSKMPQTSFPTVTCAPGFKPKISLASQRTTIVAPDLLKVGDSFNTEEDMWDTVKHFSEATGFQYYVGDSRRAASANRLKKHNFYPDGVLVYVRIHCKHFGKPKSKGMGIRKVKTMRTGCSSFIFIKYIRSVEKLVVDEMSMEHNHEVGPHLKDLYHEKCILTEEQLRTVRGMLGLGLQNKALKEHMENMLGRNLSMKFIHNLKGRLKREQEQKDSAQPQPKEICEKEQEI